MFILVGTIAQDTGTHRLFPHIEKDPEIRGWDQVFLVQANDRVFIVGSLDVDRMRRAVYVLDGCLALDIHGETQVLDGV